MAGLAIELVVMGVKRAGDGGLAKVAREALGVPGFTPWGPDDARLHWSTADGADEVEVCEKVELAPEMRRVGRRVCDSGRHKLVPVSQEYVTLGDAAGVTRSVEP